jgi:hypothetical protein
VGRPVRSRKALAVAAPSAPITDVPSALARATSSEVACANKPAPGMFATSNTQTPDSYRVQTAPVSIGD